MPEDTDTGWGPWRLGTIDDFETFPDPGAARSVADRFLDVVDRFGERDALRSPAGTWTYAELGDEVSRRAGGLRELLGDSSHPVAVLAEHDGPLVVAMLAVIVSGNVVVAVDPAAPFEQQLHVLTESGALVILHDDTHAALAEQLRDAGSTAQAGSAVRIGAAAIDSLDGAPGPRLALGTADRLLLAFTSGTSGEPKAAVVTHGVLLNLVRGATNALGIGPADRMPMLFPTSLAVAAYPMFLPLLNGGTLCTLDVRSVGLEPIPDFLEQERITLAYMAPTVIRFLVDALKGRSFPDVRMIALGGELVDAEVMALTADLFDPEHIAVGYGTTETGVVSLHVQRADAAVEGSVPCGHSVPDVEIMVLSDDGAALPRGESGEIAITSPYMFGGYEGHPELNDRVLAADPLDRPGWMLYRTGDYGRIDAAGELVIAGRVDTKVKVRGRFVVLGDVEADLHAFEEVQDCAVVPVERDGHVELVAHVVAAADRTVEGPELRSKLLERREAYRVPSRVEVIDALPRLPNGKTDRRALSEARGTGAAASEPRSDGDDRLQRTIRDLWESLLPVGIVGLDDDFASLGGDSLLAAQMLIALEHRTGVTVPMGELVHARTVRTLAEVVERLSTDDAADRSCAAMVQPGDPTRPRLWFVHDLQGSAYRVRHLARELGEDLPVWSFESPLLRGEPNRFADLEAFAARYLRDLRAAQPTGPYWLAGYSFGGICAYEMARQLRRAGEEVAFLGVVDVGPGYRGPGHHARRSPFRPWFGVAKPPPETMKATERARYYRDLLAEGPARLARHAMVRSGLFRVVDPVRFRADLRREGRVRPEWRLWYAWEEHWKLAATAWDRARTYAGELELFWADATPSADATMGWGPLVDSLEVHRFAGDHLGILEERGAAALAAALRPTIDRRHAA